MSHEALSKEREPQAVAAELLKRLDAAIDTLEKHKGSALDEPGNDNFFDPDFFPEFRGIGTLQKELRDIEGGVQMDDLHYALHRLEEHVVEMEDAALCFSSGLSFSNRLPDLSEMQAERRRSLGLPEQGNVLLPAGLDVESVDDFLIGQMMSETFSELRSTRIF